MNDRAWAKGEACGRIDFLGGVADYSGYSRMGLGCSETDAMVAAIMDLRPAHGFYGARISGGGSGGTVVVLLEESSLPRLETLRLKFGTPHPVIVV